MLLSEDPLKPAYAEGQPSLEELNMKYKYEIKTYFTNTATMTPAGANE